MHGMLTSMGHGGTKKRVDIAGIGQNKSGAHVLLTLHGGSGTDDEDLRMAIAAGINIVYINTELRVAWRRGWKTPWSCSPIRSFRTRSCRPQWTRGDNPSATSRPDLRLCKI